MAACVAVHAHANAFSGEGKRRDDDPGRAGCRAEREGVAVGREPVDDDLDLLAKVEGRVAGVRGVRAEECAHVVPENVVVRARLDGAAHVGPGALAGWAGHDHGQACTVTAGQHRLLTCPRPNPVYEPGTKPRPGLPVTAMVTLHTLSHATKTKEPVGSPEFVAKIAISAVLVLAGGVFAGYASPLCSTHALTPLQPYPRSHGP